MNCEKVVGIIAEEIRKHTDVAVIGLSGGADSTLVACLCKEALGNANVYGIGMPYNKFDMETFNANSKDIAEHISIAYEEIPVASISNAIDANITGYSKWIKKKTMTPINSGNSRSRARMCVLYGYAHALSTDEYVQRFGTKRVRVIGTGNLSEDFIGYDTKGGDALTDFFPIGDLFKSEVYQLLDYCKEKGLIEEKHINRIPSAGLEDNQTDEGDLGYTYDEMQETIMYIKSNYEKFEKEYNPEFCSDIVNFVWQRHFANKHKHEAPEVLELGILSKYI